MSVCQFYVETSISHRLQLVNCCREIFPMTSFQCKSCRRWRAPRNKIVIFQILSYTSHNNYFVIGQCALFFLVITIMYTIFFFFLESQTSHFWMLSSYVPYSIHDKFSAQFCSCNEYNIPPWNSN